MFQRLEDGRRGFIARQAMQAIGFEGNKGSARFEAFAGKIGAKALKDNEKADFPFIVHALCVAHS